LYKPESPPPSFTAVLVNPPMATQRFERVTPSLFVIEIMAYPQLIGGVRVKST